MEITSIAEYKRQVALCGDSEDASDWMRPGGGDDDDDDELEFCLDDDGWERKRDVSPCTCA